MQSDRFAQIEIASGHQWIVRRIAGAFRAGVKNGPALESLFHSPSCVCISPSGDILVCTNTDRHIRRICNNGFVESLPSCWLKPSGLLYSQQGIIVCDTGHHRIKLLSLDGKRVSSVAGVGRKGFKDGAVAVAEFNNPCSCCYDSEGSLYVVDKGNHSIRKIKDGMVVTVAGKGVPGHADGDNALFNSPTDIAYHIPTGQFFVADFGNHCIRCIRADLSSVRTIAGSPGNPGLHNGPCLGALFHFPSSLAVFASGESKSSIIIAVADTFNNQIRRIHFDTDFVDTLVGSSIAGTTDGDRSAARFHHPSWVRVKCSPSIHDQSLIVCDTENNVIREVLFMPQQPDIADSRPSTPKSSNYDSSHCSRVDLHLTHGTSTNMEDKLVSPKFKNEKFDFSPRRVTQSRQKPTCHSPGSRVSVTSIYSGTTHLFQYQNGAYRYVSPCRILLVPASDDFNKPRMEFLEIPSDKILSSCSLDSDVNISVQNFTFVYFTKFGIGCRFGNRSDSEKFLEVLKSLRLPLSDMENPRHRTVSSTSAPQSPSSYAKQRHDRPYPLEVGSSALVSRNLDHATQSSLPILCDRVARELDAVCADMLTVELSETNHSRGVFNDRHLSCWRERLLGCSGNLMLSHSLTGCNSLLQEISLAAVSASPHSPAHAVSRKSSEPLSSNGAQLQLSWYLQPADCEGTTSTKEDHLYFNVFSGEIVKLVLCFRGRSIQIIQQVLVLTIPDHQIEKSCHLEFDTDMNVATTYVEIRIPTLLNHDSSPMLRSFPMAIYALSDDNSANSLDSNQLVLRLAIYSSQGRFEIRNNPKQSKSEMDSPRKSIHPVKTKETCHAEIRFLGFTNAFNP